MNDHANHGDVDVDVDVADAEQLERNKRIAWAHFRALAEGRLDDCLALLADGVYWRNTACHGRHPSVSMQVWKKAVTAIIERRVPIPWQAEHVHLANIFAEGDQVVLEIHNDSLPYHEGRNGDSYDMVYLFVVVVRDGQIVAIREYPDGFLVSAMLEDGTAPELGTTWWDLESMEDGPGVELPPGVCAGCGMVHVDEVTGVGRSGRQLLADRNKELAWRHFSAVNENRADDARSLLGDEGYFWGAARSGRRPRGPISIQSWHRELTAIIEQRLPMPWTGGAHLVNAVAEGDQVLVEIHNTSPFHAHFPGTGLYDMIYAWVLTVRDDKIIDVREYPDGIYGDAILREWFPDKDAATTPVDMLGELPRYEAPAGTCTSCAKIHRDVESISTV